MTKPVSFFEAVQAILAVLVTLAVILACLLQLTLPEEITIMWYIIVGSYFGTHAGQKLTNGKNSGG